MIRDTFTVDNGGERAKPEFFETVPTKRENPCDTCPRVTMCDTQEVDCFAFRRWSNCGDYSDTQVQHLIRKFD